MSADKFSSSVGSPLRHGTASPSNSSLKRYSSPSGRFNSVHDGDRFIPNRLFSNLEDALDGSLMSNASSSNADGVSCENKEYFNYLLRSELLGSSAAGASDRSLLGSITKSSLFKYNSNSPSASHISRNSLSPDNGLSSNSDGHESPNFNISMLSPNHLSRGGSISSPQNPPKPSRKISKLPYKVLDAPSLEDDFYLNLLDWSSTNFLAVGLGKMVYTWSACTSQVTQLHNFEENGSVTSISWSNKGDLLAVGCSDGSVSIWDPVKIAKIREFKDHAIRVGATAWSSNLLATGSRDRNIMVYDLRIKSSNSDSEDLPKLRDGNENIDSKVDVGDTSSDSMDPLSSSRSSAAIQPTTNNVRAAVSSGLTSSLSTSSSVFDSSNSTNELLLAAEVGSEMASTDASHSNDSVDSALDSSSIYPSNTASAAAHASSRYTNSSYLGSSRNSSTSPPFTSRKHNPALVFDFRGHKQEVCGLKWSFDEKYIASGGNDNKLLIWNVAHGHSNSTTAGNMLSKLHGRENPYIAPANSSMDEDFQSTSSSGATYPHLSRNPSAPMYQFDDHIAAVKAVAWSPHQSGLLASGGGTADRHIRFWNVLNGTSLTSIDTGSQVCNLMWSKTVNEFVSTHGYSLNQIIVWKYPSLQKMAILTGHTFRVLYLGMSPDGQTVVTGAGDETLRFWNVFPPAKHGSGIKMGSNVILSSANMDIR